MNIFIVENVKNNNNILEEQNNNLNISNNNIYDDDNICDFENISEDKLIIQKKKKLIEISKNLSNLEYIEIFNILQKENCLYSDNNNGVFINLHNIDIEIIDKIFNFLDFIKNKKDELKKQDSYLESIKKENNENEKIKENLSHSLFIDKNNYKQIDEELINDYNNINIEEYLCFSSDDEKDLDDKINLKKKKNKYTGKKARIIKSIKDTNSLVTQY